jgi:hypothetical protein
MSTEQDQDWIQMEEIHDAFDTWVVALVGLDIIMFVGSLILLWRHT